PREPYVVKQDNGSFVDKIIFDLNKALDSPHLHIISLNQFHCYHCKDVLRDAEACKQCTCAKCGSGLGKGLCYICGHNQNSLNDSLSISEISSQSPPNINHCCYECGDPLDGIFYKRCTCKFCGKDAHIGHNCQSKVLVISNPEPCNNQTINELLQTLIIFHPTFHSEAKSPFTLDSTPTYFDESPIVFNPPPQPPVESEGIPEHKCDVPFHDNSPPLDVSKDQFENLSESNEEFSSTDDDSFSFDKIDYVEASPPDSELVSSKVMEIVIPEVGRIEASNGNPIPFYDPIISGTPPNLTPSGESDFFLEVDAFLAVEDEPTLSQFPKSYLDPEGDMLLFEAFLNDDHSSDFKPKSSSTSLNSLLEETNNFNNSLPKFTTFSKVLFDAEYESDSSDDHSCSDEDVLKTIVSKPLCEEEIIPMKSLRTYDSSLPISSKIDSLLDEFAGELTLLKSIPSRIDETDCDFEDDICLIEKLLYDNSSPRPPKEFISANSDAANESFSPSPILVKDSDSLIEEIDLFCTPDYPMPPGIVDADYDSERNILILKDLRSYNTLSFAEKVSFYFDIPLFSRPSSKPPNGDTGILNIKMMGDISDQKDFMHKLMITLASHHEGNASPPDSEFVSSEVMEIVIPKVGGIEASNNNPIPFYDPIISGTPPNLTPSGESDFFLEVNALLAVEDEFTSSQFPKLYLDPDGDMLLFEAFLDDDHSSDFKTKSASTSLKSLLEETNNFNNSLPQFTTFSMVLFDAECESDSSDDQSCFDEDVLEKTILKPLCEEEIIPMKSLRTHDSSLLISSKIDSLLDELAGELTLLKSISPGINETDCDFEEDIRLIEKLLYDNSSPRPPEEFVSANSDAASESFSPSPILVKDNDSL
nr:hypothetical protein [Tanacetum cinerariifolium]